LTETTIAAGHVDAFAVRLEGLGLAIYVRDSTGAGNPVWRPPGDVVLVAKPESRTSVPDNSQFSFLGPPGSPVWVLPQIQNPALLWPGWTTEEVENGAVAGNSIRWTLLSIQGPGGFALFSTDQFGTPAVLFNSTSGLPSSFNIAAGVHAHGNWAFKAAGRYILQVQASATLPSGAPVSANAALTFDIQGGAASLPPLPAATSPPVPTAASTIASAISPGPPAAPSPLTAGAAVEPSATPGALAASAPQPAATTTPAVAAVATLERQANERKAPAAASADGADNGAVSGLVIGIVAFAVVALGAIALLVRQRLSAPS
jgi:surface-anchored protein